MPTKHIKICQIEDSNIWRKTMKVSFRRFIFIAINSYFLIGINITDAKVCFLPSNDCGDGVVAATTTEENCKYTITSCDKPKVPSDDFCMRSGIKYYKECVCPPEFKYDKTDDKYEYGNECNGKYDKKICKKEYSYITRITNLADFNREILKNNLNGPVEHCINNSDVDTSDICVETSLENTFDDARRFSHCRCDTSTYKYRKIMKEGYIKEVFNEGELCKRTDSIEVYTKPTCTGNKYKGHFYKDSCSSNETDIDAEKKTWYAMDNSSSVTCRACVQLNCEYYEGYSSNPLRGYRVKTYKQGDFDCYKKDMCQVGDFVMEGGYCYDKESDITEATKEKLKALGTGVEKTLGIIIKLTENKSEYSVEMRVAAKENKYISHVAVTESYDSKAGFNKLYEDKNYSASLKASSYAQNYVNGKNFDGKSIQWEMMDNKDVNQIVDYANEKIRDKLLTIFNHNEMNLFAVLIDEENEKGQKICKKHASRSEAKYAYADVYPCYWIENIDKKQANRAVMNPDFKGVASKNNYWPRFTYGTHIYMRNTEGYNGKQSYDNYLWYSSFANPERIDVCSLGSTSKVTLKKILFEREQTCPSYIPLSYGVRYYYFEGLLGLPYDDPNNPDATPEYNPQGAIVSPWPKGIQPWRILAMYGGECSDKESKKSVCRDDNDGKGFYCRMRMYWHGSSWYCVNSLYGNSSKLPTEKCFSESLAGTDTFFYGKTRFTNWNYVEQSSFNYKYPTGHKKAGENSFPKSDYNWYSTVKDYETGIQGCFVKPVTTYKVDLESVI